MTVWTMDQMRKVRGLRSEAVIDTARTEQAVIDIKAATREKMVRQLTQMAHPFAVECHPADFQFSEAAEDENRMTIKIRCWWEPTTREVEFHGGQQDGVLLEVERVGTPVMLAEMQGVDWNVADLGPDEPLTPKTAVYDLTGWDEINRRWVYTRTS